MVGPTLRVRALSLAAIAGLVVAACGGSATPSAPENTAQASGSAETTAPTSGPTKGGTIYLLSSADNWVDVDPQRIYTGEDLAFFGGTIYRALESYKYSADPVEGTKLTPDLATDLGTASDGGKTWTFTLVDGATWQDGSALTCADVAYGVSREFATDIMGGGPSYAIQYLDIPYKSDGSSEYPGPYTATAAQQALFDKAVVCSGNTITFHLNAAHGDFNYATTLGMDPVPNPKDHPGVDIGEGYGITKPPFASGPYMVQSYTPGAGGTMILVRNPAWNAASDPTGIHPAYPDKWEVDFGIDPKLMDQRLMSPSGNDSFALQYGQVQPENLPTIFKDAHTPNDAFAGRAISGFDPYTRYFWVDINKVPNEKIRQAMSVALDRQSSRTLLGGDFYGDYATGAIKPNEGADYADTGFFTTMFGQAVPYTGATDLAKQLIAESGVAAPTLKWNYADTPVAQQYFAIVQDSLGKAGITVTPGAIPRGDYYKVVFDPKNDQTGEFGNTGWGPDWPNGSTVIAPLYTEVGGWDLSKANDPAFNAAVQDAIGTTDRAAQAAKWQALDKQATQSGWIIPTFFGNSQTIAGDKLGPIYRWPAYGSWPYGQMYVVQ
jgi:peptide/nickel transport system substrate-binding protein